MQLGCEGASDLHQLDRDENTFMSQPSMHSAVSVAIDGIQNLLRLLPGLLRLFALPWLLMTAAAITLMVLVPPPHPSQDLDAFYLTFVETLPWSAMAGLLTLTVYRLSVLGRNREAVLQFGADVRIAW